MNVPHQIFLSIAAIFSFLQGYAQSNELDSIVLDPVTVTAGIRPLQSSRTGRNIVVLEGDVLSQLPVNSIDEILRYVPGVEMQFRGPMGAQTDISMRGGTFQQVLVILDGIRLNDPNTGHFSAYIPIAPAEIDRIEVLKGPASAIYGTEAVGGVIHIITKAFAQKKGKSVSAKMAVGEYGLFNIQSGFSLQQGNHFLAGGVLSNHTKGQMQRGTRGYLDMTTVSLAYTAKIDDHWHAGLRTAFDYRDFAAQNFYTAFTSDTANERVKCSWNQMQVGYRNEKFSWSLNAGYKWLNDRYQFNGSLSPNDNSSALTQILSTAQWTLSDHSNLIAGVQWLHKKIESNDRGNHKLDQGGLFLILQQQIAQGLMIAPAVRAEYNESSGFEIVPQMSISYRTGILQLRGAAGRTLRDADFTERYNNYNRVGVRSGSIGNPDLKNETSFSYEAGVDVYATKSFRVSATAFSRVQNRVIDFVPTAYDNMPRKENLVPGGQYALASNIAQTNVSGVETDLQYLQHWDKQVLQAGAGFVWLNTNVKEGTPGFYLSSHARLLTNFYVVYTIGRFGASVNGVYKLRDEREASAINTKVNGHYFVWNAKLQGNITKWVQAFVQVDNAGDASYSDLLGSVMPRRWLMGGFQMKLP